MAALDDYRQVLDDIRELAVDMLLAILRGSDLSDRRRAFDSLREAFRDVVHVFGEQAAFAAVRYLEQDRTDAGVFNRLPRPRPADPLTNEQIDVVLGWGTAPLAEDRPDGPQAVQARLEGSTLRLVQQPARETVFAATEEAGTRYARVPRPDACPFCLMLASRGADYLRETVLTTTGRSKRGEGQRFHDDCRCTSAEVRDEAELPDINRRLEDLWIDHGGSFGKWQEYLAENPLS